MGKATRARSARSTPKRKGTEKEAASKIGKRARNKGNGFERLIAKDLRETLGLEIEDIFRTPLSGGHPGMRAGDLMLSAKAAAMFPWSVECKNTKGWHAGAFLQGRENERKWTQQCIKACRKGLYPMLIVKGKGTCPYAIARKQDWQEVLPKVLKSIPRVVFRNPADNSTIWVQVPWQYVLKHLA